MQPFYKNIRLSKKECKRYNESMQTQKEFQNLYEEFRAPIFRFLVYKTKDEHLAHELVNDVFFKASRSLKSLKEPQKLQSWLYKIASNLVVDHYRKQKTNTQSIHEGLYEELPQEGIYEELSCCVEHFVNQLQPSYAKALSAVYLQEQTLQEYANTQKLKLSTVKSHVKRAKTQLKQFFEQCCVFEKNHAQELSAILPNKAKKECC